MLFLEVLANALSCKKKKKKIKRYKHWEVKVKVAQSCPALCDPMDSTVHGILQARILDWVAFPFTRGSSQPRDQTQVSRIAGRFFTSWATREAQTFEKKITKLWFCYLKITWLCTQKTLRNWQAVILESLTGISRIFAVREILNFYLSAVTNRKGNSGWSQAQKLHSRESRNTLHKIPRIIKKKDRRNIFEY